jgi:aryl-alcohol dehydrogenase (NADP+)
MWSWQFAKAQFTAQANRWTRFVSMQNHYNLISREEEREMIPFCMDQGVGIIPWSPLARGFLAGNRTPERGGNTRRSDSDTIAHRLYYASEDWEVLKQLQEISSELGVSSTRLALAWLLNRPGVTSPIIGVTKLAHLDDLVAAIDLELESDQMAALEAPYRPKLPAELQKGL